ncbi:MAG: hydrogenase formation protein HypD [Methylocystaceae bacterium]
MTREYKDLLLGQILLEKGPVALMEVCGTHTMAIAKSGIKNLLPANIKLLSGPGCPVCVTAQSDIDQVIALTKEPGVVLTTFGDMIRVPGSASSLQSEKAQGADVRVVYSPRDAIQLAEETPNKEIIFLGIGFETTAPVVAATIEEAAERGINNFSVWSLHKIVPPALKAILADPEIQFDGLICPGHVSAVIGAEVYELLAEEYQKPCVITGFETTDILEGIYMLIKQVGMGRHQVENQYQRVVKPQGNLVAKKLLEEVFTTKDARWRGLGNIPASGLALNDKYENYDARKRFRIPEFEEREIKGCSCGDILKGKLSPLQCQLFGRACTPARPIGPCMVSSEGACAAHYRYHPAGGDKYEK